MPVTNEAEVVAVETETLVSHLAETTDGPLYSVVEYGPGDLNVVYAEDATTVFYGDRDHLLSYFDRVRSTAQVDFDHVELFADAFSPVADRVDHATPTPASVQFLRVANERNGLFVALAPEEPLAPVVRAIQRLCRGSR